MMINALEARKISNEVLHLKYEELISSIERKIVSAAKVGMRCTFVEQIPSDMVSNIKTLGYSIEYNQKEDVFIIKW